MDYPDLREQPDNLKGNGFSIYYHDGVMLCVALYIGNDNMLHQIEYDLSSSK